VGDSVGLAVGDAVGEVLGETVGEKVGELLGAALGDAVGAVDGEAVGVAVGTPVGARVVGAADGARVQWSVSVSSEFSGPKYWHRYCIPHRSSCSSTMMAVKCSLVVHVSRHPESNSSANVRQRAVSLKPVGDKVGAKVGATVGAVGDTVVGAAVGGERVVGDAVGACSRRRRLLAAVGTDVPKSSGSESVSKSCAIHPSASSSVVLHSRIQGATDRSVGLSVGEKLVVGAMLGDSVGVHVSPGAVGVRVLGEPLGATVVGAAVGDRVGVAVVGMAVGELVVGELVGGAVLGDAVGDAEGEAEGAVVVGGAVGAAVLGEAEVGERVGEPIVGGVVGEMVVGAVVVCSRRRAAPTDADDTSSRSRRRYAVVWSSPSPLTASTSHACHGGSSANGCSASTRPLAAVSNT
jgi:hypothetical protein